MRRPRILFYVQNLLGIGHQARAAAITRAMQRAGLQVYYVNGGTENLDLDLGGATVAPLPPVRAANASFQTLVDENGAPVDAAWEANRRRILLELFREIRPNAILVESYPFGRRRFRFELLPLFKAAKGTAPIAISVRDILVQKNKPGRAEETADIVNNYAEAVLVHGDPALVKLDATFPATHLISSKISYSGLVSASSDAALIPDDKRLGVIVSAGGGAVGQRLLQTAMAARPFTRFAGDPWLFLTGPNAPDDLAVLDVNGDSLPENVTIERFRPRFQDALGQVTLSISQAGYNTVLDLLVTQTRGLLVPFSAPGETEQALRADLFRRRGDFSVLDEKNLNPKAMAAAIDDAGNMPPPNSSHLNLQGAENTANVMVNLAARQQGMT